MAFQRSSHRAESLSEGARKGQGFGCLVLFGALFLAVGCILAAVFVAAPLWRAYAARDWVEVPCTILESRVGKDDDGTAYRVEVRYEYRYGAGVEAGRPAPRYVSNRYDLSNGVYTSGRKGKQAVVDRLPPGTKTTCRVDPRRPDQAVLDAGLPSTMWLGLFTLLFPMAGAAAVAFGIRGMRRERARRKGRLPQSADARPPAADYPGDMPGPCVLEPAAGRRGRALGLGIFAVFWNGVVWTIFIAGILPDARDGLSISLGVAFISIFLLIGLFIAGAAIHAVLALANPRIRFTLNRRAVRPGERLELQWECEGNASRIEELTIAIEGWEEATYSRGTTTSTDKRIFARIPVKTVEGFREIETGRTAVAMPADAAPTFDAPHNKLRWRLAVRGVIRHWPDVDDAHDLLVLPPGKEEST